MDQPCWQNVTGRSSFADASGNLADHEHQHHALLDSNAQALVHPGQWFLDVSSNTLYFGGPKSVASLDVELPHLESLLQGAGSLGDPVHDLTFSGLQFSYATWNEPSSPAGFADVQSNLTMSLPGGNQGMCTFSSPNGNCPWGALTQPAVNVGFSGSNDITLSGDRFIDLGGAGLGFEYGDTDDTVSDSLFDHIASTAILLGCTYDPTPTVAEDAQAIIEHCSLDPSVAGDDSIGTNEILQHTTVSDNVIEHVGTDYTSASGITLLFSQHTTITHNDIFDVPYTGITAGVIQGHVDDQTHPQESVNVNGFNTISDNLIHDYMQVRSDGGAMYIEGHQAQYVENADGSVDQQATLANGMQAVGNVAYNKVNSSPVMYDDAGSEYINWQNNVLFRVNGNSSQGGCDPTGPFGLEGNYGSGGFESYFCMPSGVSIQTFASGNTTIPDSPGPNDLPASAIDGAGVSAATAANLISYPQADYESAESSSTAAIPNAVLIAGEGFSPNTPISFSGRRATTVNVLSPGLVIATVPPHADSSDLVVGNPPAAPTITAPSPGSVDVPGNGLTVSGTGQSGTSVTVTVDNQPLSGCATPVSGGHWSCDLGPTASGRHTLTATAQDATGQSASSGPTLIYVGGLPPARDRLDDTDPSFSYGNGWSYSSNRGLGDLGDDLHYATADGTSLTYTFLGTGIKVFGEFNSDQGNVGFTVDGGPQQTVDTSTTGSRQSDALVFERLGLTPGQHTITITKLSGDYMTFDGVEVDYTLAAGSFGPRNGMHVLVAGDGSSGYHAEIFDGTRFVADRGGAADYDLTVLNGTTRGASGGGTNILGGATGTLGWQGPFQNGVGSVPGTVVPGTTPDGASAVHWAMASAASDTWIQVPVSQLVGGIAYEAAVTLQGTGNVFLDFYDGTRDNQSAPVTLSSTPQTLTLDVTVPAGGTNTPQFQVRTSAACRSPAGLRRVGGADLGDADPGRQQARQPFPRVQLRPGYGDADAQRGDGHGGRYGGHPFGDLPLRQRPGHRFALRHPGLGRAGRVLVRPVHDLPGRQSAVGGRADDELREPEPDQ